MLSSPPPSSNTSAYPPTAYLYCAKCGWKTLRFGRHRRPGNRKLTLHFIDAHWDDGGQNLYARLEKMEDEDGAQYVF